MTKDGQNSATADLNMGGNKLKNGKTATLVKDFTIVSDIQNAVHTYVTSTGSANAYVITLATAPAALVAGQPFSFKANFANTGPVTLNVNSLGAKALERYGSIPLITGEIRVDQIVIARYDGTKYQAISINDVPVPVASKFGALVVQNAADNGFELLSGQGTSAQVLTSNGVDALPTFQDLSAGGAWVLIETKTASTSSVLDFTSNIDSTHDVYVFILADLLIATGSSLHILTSTDGGSNYDTGASNYSYSEIRATSSGASDFTGSTGATEYRPSGGENISSDMVSGEVYLYAPSNATDTLMKTTLTVSTTNSTAISTIVSSGKRDSAADVDAIRFTLNNGSFTSGRITLYGISHI